MAELVKAHDLSSCGEILVGSSPTPRKHTHSPVVGCFPSKEMARVRFPLSVNPYYFL